MPEIRLTYFAIAGAAEKVRLSFVLGNVAFEDERIKWEDWKALKPTTPYGQVPVLSVDGRVISQSDAMVRYAASLAPALYPPELALGIDEIIGLVGDFNRAWEPCLYMGISPERYGAAAL